VRLLLAHLVLGAERERRAERLRAVRAVVLRAVAVRAVAVRAVAVREAAARESEEMALVAERAEERRCWQGWRRKDLETLAQLDARLHAAAQLDARLGPLAAVLRRPDRAGAAHLAAAGGGGEREQHGGSHRTREVGNSEREHASRGRDRDLVPCTATVTNIKPWSLFSHFGRS